MNEAKGTLRLILVGILTAIATFIWWPEAGGAGTCEVDRLCVTFFDVGQGDATLIQTPEGVKVLIDGGAGSGIVRKLSTALGAFDREIDMVIGTHPDQDHVGGLVHVFDRYEVATVVMTENKGQSAAAAAYIIGVRDESAEVVLARRGQELQLGASTTLRVLFPDGDPTNMESNTSSIVIQLTYGETSFMLTGDSPKNIEEYLVLIEGENLQSTVLKIGHHGSRTSTSELFLNEVAPEIAVISAGKDNRYGHPHVEVTDMLFNARVETYSTAEEGDITLISDGTSVSLK